MLVSLVLFTAVLTCATLLVVRQSVQGQLQRQIEEDARNDLLTIQAVQHQREMMLSRKANLLATSAYIRNGDPSTIQEASADPWQSGECDLFAIADPQGRIIALHTTSSMLSVANAEKLLRRTFREDTGVAWWFDEGHLFQVVMQPYYEQEPRKGRLLGTAIVGRELDVREPASSAGFPRAISCFATRTKW